ncbi:MAG: hypothetical protein HZB51_23355 [Chloroflexi bacterium]|nr:hypothetical protein [Chloroflexota bacterium]
MFKRVMALLLVFLISLALFVKQSENSKAASIPSQGASNSLTRATENSVVYLPLVMKNYSVPLPLWRFGTAVAQVPLADYDVYGAQNLRLGWYTNWQVINNAPQPYGTEYIPMVRLKQWKLASDGVSWTTWCITCPYVEPYTYTVSPSWNTINLAATSRPGMLWVIGNEIERRDWSSGRQDEILPEVYAQAYNDIRNGVLSIDPTAQFAIAGLVEVTPLRLQYLDRVWNAYSQTFSQTMPVDVWNIHVFVLPEDPNSWGAAIPAGISATIGMTYTELDNINFSMVTDQIVSFRSWMKAHGEQNKPLIMTEYGVNMPDWILCDTWPNTSGCPFTKEQVRDNMMYPSFDYFLNHTDVNLGYPLDGYRLVQRWNWWSLDYDAGKIEDFGNGSGFAMDFNGALFYSGLYVAKGGNPKGITALGYYWTHYVQSLPLGATKPYALVLGKRLPIQSQVHNPIMAKPGGGTSLSDCDNSKQIRLLFYEPSPGFWGNVVNRGLAPKLKNESKICLPAKR